MHAKTKQNKTKNKNKTIIAEIVEASLSDRKNFRVPHWVNGQPLRKSYKFNFCKKNCGHFYQLKLYLFFVLIILELGW